MVVLNKEQNGPSFRRWAVKDETKEVLLSIYEDNRKLMLQLKEEVDQKRLCTDKTLNAFFAVLHETVSGQMTDVELHEQVNKVSIGNLLSGWGI